MPTRKKSGETYFEKAGHCWRRCGKAANSTNQGTTLGAWTTNTGARDTLSIGRKEVWQRSRDSRRDGINDRGPWWDAVTNEEATYDADLNPIGHAKFERCARRVRFPTDRFLNDLETPNS